jgi:SAM-dependent methyltransferase
VPPAVAAPLNLRSAPQMREYEHIVARVGRDRPAKVLDWGCGYGQVSHLLLERGLDVTSLEYVPDAEEGRRSRLGHFPDVEAIMTREPVRLPFDDATFDAVLSVGVLEHVAQPDASLDELRRVLVPGGRLYVYKLPNRWSYLEWIARRAGMYYHGKLPEDTIYTLRGTRRMLERHGFRVEEARLANMVPLTLPGLLVARLTPALWAVNRALSKVPLLRAIATNVEAIAIKPG